MAHLKKAGTGHLLKSGGGHLVKDCGCDNACNACDPCIPDTMFITFSNLDGDFAALNKKLTLVWLIACAWSILDGETGVGFLAWGRSSVCTDEAPNWTAIVTLEDSRCRFGIRNLSLDSCTPTGTYTDVCYCLSSFCSATGSCDDTSGWQAVVSLT